MCGGLATARPRDEKDVKPSPAQPDTTAIEAVKRSRWLLFAVLAVLWCFPSAGALYILCWTRPDRMGGEGWESWIGSIRIEDYIAAALLLVHGVFVWVALSGRRPGGAGSRHLERSP